MSQLPPTQEVESQSQTYFSQNGTQESFWGILLPYRDTFKRVDLVKSEYSFGRANKCDVPITDIHFENIQYVSTVHFKIYRDNDDTVYLEDYSLNGTYVNREKVGKGKKVVLKSHAEIALARSAMKVFVFVDFLNSDAHNYPDVINQTYTVSRQLGKGACGEVRLVFTKGNCKRYAMKIIEKKTLSNGEHPLNDPKRILTEVKILQKMNHPCIIEIIDFFDIEDKVYIILELMEGGELFDYIKVQQQLCEEEAKLIFYQITCAVKYLHMQGITHRDLKLENVLLTKDTPPLIKVTDFGLSKLMDSASLMKTFCGTPNYLAPEIMMQSGKYTELVDVWSMGVILFASLGGYLPFSSDYDHMSLEMQIKKGYYRFAKQQWCRVSENAKDLVRKMLTVKPQNRITVDGILAHPWLQDEAMKEKANKLMGLTADVSMVSLRSSMDNMSCEPPQKRFRVSRIEDDSNER